MRREREKGRGGGSEKRGGVCGKREKVRCVVRMIESALGLSRVVPKMQRIRVAEHLGASSRRPRHPRALDDEELFIIEGSPGAQRPDGRSAKNGLKRPENPLSPP